jgi:hypothetical protein
MDAGIVPAERSTGLLARYDDPADPGELTLYDPASETPLTEWLSTDPETARSLDAMR